MSLNAACGCEGPLELTFFDFGTPIKSPTNMMGGCSDPTKVVSVKPEEEEGAKRLCPD